MFVHPKNHSKSDFSQLTNRSILLFNPNLSYIIFYYSIMAYILIYSYHLYSITQYYNKNRSLGITPLFQYSPTIFSDIFVGESLNENYSKN